MLCDYKNRSMGIYLCNLLNLKIFLKILRLPKYFVIVPMHLRRENVRPKIIFNFFFIDEELDRCIFVV